MAKYTKNARGYYKTSVLVGHDADGKKVRKWIYAKTINELERKIAATKNAISSGLDLLAEDVPFGVYADRWFRTYKANRGINTRQMYKHLIEKSFEALNLLRVKEIRPMNLQALINEYSDRPRTCEQMRMTLRQIFDQAIADGLIVKNPAAGLEIPRRVVKEKRALTADEKQAILTIALTPQQRAFIMIAYGCGLRPGELYALTWDDIDFKNKTIRINKALAFENNNKSRLVYPKTNKSIRTVYAPEVVMKALREYRSTTIAPKLFGGPTGEYKSMTPYLNDWKRIKRKIDAALGYETDLTMYCLRHSYATDLYYADISQKEAQRLLGHNSYKMIMDVYAHLDAEKEDTAAKLDRIMSGTKVVHQKNKAAESQ